MKLLIGFAVSPHSAKNLKNISRKDSKGLENTSKNISGGYSKGLENISGGFSEGLKKYFRWILKGNSEFDLNIQNQMASKY